LVNSKNIKLKPNQLSLPLDRNISDFSLHAIALESKEVNLIIKSIKKNSSMRQVAKETGLSYSKVDKILFNEFGCRSIRQLRQKLGIKRKPSNEKIKRLIKVKEVYERCGTLQKAADELNLTRERVRQLLNEGEDHQLFKYEIQRQVNHKERLNKLKTKFQRDDLVKTIKRHGSKSEIYLELEVSQAEFESLLEFFNMDYEEYAQLSKMGKCLEDYSSIVDSLGHHPTTTEMTKRRDWRNLWGKITRLWSSMDNFRKEYGIEKPKHRMHPNTIAAWKKAGAKPSLAKNQNKENLLNLITRNRIISRKDIDNELDLGRGQIYTYIRELVSEGAIIKIGIGSKMQYKIK
jgi:DNA-binding phage protein